MRAGLRWIGIAAICAACEGDRGDADTRDAGAERTSGRSAASATSRAGAAGDARRTVLFVGTSLTAGYGLDPEQTYPALIERKLDSAGLEWDVVNAGLSGETSAAALRRIDWLLRTPADVIVLETGANDGLRGLNIDSTRANIQAIIDRIRGAQPDARIVLVQMEAPPNFGPSYTARFRSMFADLARRNEGVVLMPFLLEGVAGEPELNLPDGIHPNPAGSRVVAENVWRTLREVLTGRAGSG